MADMLPDWASGILGAVQKDTGLDLSSLANSFLGGGSASQPGIVKSNLGVSIGGPYGINFTSGGGGGSGGAGAGRDVGGDVGVSFHSIQAKLRNKFGFRVRRKTVLYIIRTLGFVVASQILGLDISDVLFLFMHKRRGSRRHFVQTMVKAIKKGERYRHQLSKYKIPHARRSSGGNFGQRMAAHRRRKKAA
jgi:hypothetical protein